MVRHIELENEEGGRDPGEDKSGHEGTRGDNFFEPTQSACHIA